MQVINSWRLLRFAHLYLFFFLIISVSAAAESERGESLHRECGQEAGHHGPADQVHTFTASVFFLQQQRHNMTPWIYCICVCIPVFPPITFTSWYKSSLPFSFVGNTEIDVDIKKYYCRAGIKSIQVWEQYNAKILIFRSHIVKNISLRSDRSCPLMP